MVGMDQLSSFRGVLWSCGRSSGGTSGTDGVSWPVTPYPAVGRVAVSPAAWSGKNPTGAGRRRHNAGSGSPAEPTLPVAHRQQAHRAARPGPGPDFRIPGPFTQGQNGVKWPPPRTVLSRIPQCPQVRWTLMHTPTRLSRVLRMLGHPSLRAHVTTPAEGAVFLVRHAAQ